MEFKDYQHALTALDNGAILRSGWPHYCVIRMVNSRIEVRNTTGEWLKVESDIQTLKAPYLCGTWWIDCSSLNHE